MINMASPWLGPEEKKAVCEVIDSGMIACGEVVREFEAAFANYCGAKHGIATTSGTTALEVAIRSLDLDKKARILTPAFSFIASSNAIIYAGAEPVFVDLDADTFNIDYDKIEAAIKKEPDIKALMIVHLFGKPCDMDRVKSITQKHNLLLIEDCAQAHGATFKGKTVGSFGDVAAFSFYPTKNMTTGEGGMVTTSNHQYAQKARMLINHGMQVRYHHDIIGYNYRMTNIAAALGLCQLQKLPMMNRKRIGNASYYSENIDNPLVITPQHCDGHVYHQYTVRIKNGLRDKFLSALNEHNIGSAVFYPLSLPEQKCYKGKGYLSECPVTDYLKNQVVSIPVQPQLTVDELKRVVAVINSFNQ